MEMVAGVKWENFNCFTSVWLIGLTEVKSWETRIVLTERVQAGNIIPYEFSPGLIF
jgi:hypothetical protein